MCIAESGRLWWLLYLVEIRGTHFQVPVLSAQTREPPWLRYGDRCSAASSGHAKVLSSFSALEIHRVEIEVLRRQHWRSRSVQSF
ncbi:hypothetical protein NL676_039392 [Syzygium grande]|nr:hypothetical protein NL676_039392 [Syzygium grande]